MNYIKWFDDITLKNISEVGGKNASLGEMIQELSKEGIDIPYGFAITAKGYWHFINYNKLLNSLKRIMKPVR